MTPDQISLLLQLQLRQTLALEKMSDALERLKDGKFAIPNKGVDPVSKAYMPPYEIQIGARIKLINEKLFGEIDTPTAAKPSLRSVPQKAVGFFLHPANLLRGVSPPK